MINRIDISPKSILKVAIPISLGTFVQFIVSFTDNYFVAQLEGNAMSAVSFVGLMYIALIMIGIGLGNAAQILIARRKGEGRLDEAGEITGNAIRLSILVAVVQLLILFVVIPPMLDTFITHHAVSNYMKDFIHYRAWGFLFYTPVLMLNAFWSGIAQTRVMIYTASITAVVNIVLDYGLVFGNFGMPRLGVEGAAIATVVSEMVSLIFMVIYTVSRYDKYHSVVKFGSYNLKKWLRNGSWRFSQTLVKLGTPISFQMLLSLGLWVVFYGFVEKMGESELQASFIVRQMYMLAFISIGGLSTTTKTYISALIAEKRQSEMKKVILRLMSINFLGVVFLSHGLWLYPHFIASHFTENATTIAQTIDTMHIVLPAMLIFSLTSILLGVVEGSGNTMTGFVIELISVVLYIGAAYLMIFGFEWPIHLVWTSDYVYYVLIGVFSMLYLLNGKWKYKEI